MPQLLVDFWSFLTANKDPLDILLRIFEFIIIPIGAILAVIRIILKRAWKKKVRTGIKSYEVIKDPSVLLEKIYNEEGINDPISHHCITYTPRDPNCDTQAELKHILNTKRYLLITGHTGWGKTREAGVLAQSFMNEGYRVLWIKAGWIEAPTEFLSEFNNDRHRILIFLDDLNLLFKNGETMQPPKLEEKPYMNELSYHDRLLKMINTMESLCGENEIRVLATARNEEDEWKILKYSPSDKLWKRFVPIYELNMPLDKTIEHVFRKTSTIVEGLVKEDDIPILARINDGTYKNAILNLQRAKREQVILTADNYRETLQGSWREYYIKAISKLKAIEYIYDAIDILNQAGIELYPWIVEPTAAIIWNGNWIKKIKHKLNIQNAMEYLTKQGVLAKYDGKYKPQDGQIEAKHKQIEWIKYKDPIINIVINSLEKYPNKIETSILGFCRSLTEMDDYQDANHILSKAIQKGSKNNLLYIDKGITSYLIKDYPAAIQDYNQAIQLDPNDASAFNNRGGVYYDLKDYPAAIQDYNQAIQLDPNDARYLNNRGGAYADLKDYPAAIQDYNQAMQLNPNDAAAFYNRGIVYHNLKDYTAAIKDYNQAIQLDPNDARAFNNRGVVYYDLKDYQAAILDFTKANQLGLSEVSAINSRGNAYYKLKNYQAAILDFTQTIQLDPNDANAFNKRGMSYVHLKDYPAAIQDYNQAIQLNPSYAAAFYNRGMVYYNLKDYPAAIKDLTQAIQLDPNDAGAFNNRGVVYYDLKDYPAAILDFTQTIQLDPNDASAFNNRGGAYDDLKDYPAAIKDYNQAIQLNPSYAAAFYNRGMVYHNLKDYPAAIKDFTQAIQLDPRYAAAFNNRGKVYYDLKDYPAAIKDFTQAIQLDSQYSSTIYNLACIYALLKECKQTCEWLTKAINQDKIYIKLAKEDADFDGIRDCPEFIRLLSDSDKKPDE